MLKTKKVQLKFAFKCVVVCRSEYIKLHISMCIVSVFYFMVSFKLLNANTIQHNYHFLSQFLDNKLNDMHVYELSPLH